MTIVFALLVWFDGSYRYPPVKVGEYEKLAMCTEQGTKLKRPAPSIGASHFICVPVNATGQR